MNDQKGMRKTRKGLHQSSFILRYLSTDKQSKGKDKEVLIGFNNTEVTNEGNLSEMVEVEPILE